MYKQAREGNTMFTLTNHKPAVHITTTYDKELFTNPRATALGNDQLYKDTAKVCANGICQTTWKPVKPSVIKLSGR